MTVLSQVQIDRMVIIMDFILKYTQYPVDYIMKKFNITSEEYNMIFDLCMPSIRMNNKSDYWRSKYSSLRDDLLEYLKNVDPNKENIADDISKIVDNNRIGPLNVLAKTDMEESA